MPSILFSENFCQNHSTFSDNQCSKCIVKRSLEMLTVWWQCYHVNHDYAVTKTDHMGVKAMLVFVFFRIITHRRVRFVRVSFCVPPCFIPTPSPHFGNVRKLFDITVNCGKLTSLFTSFLIMMQMVFSTILFSHLYLIQGFSLLDSTHLVFHFNNGLITEGTNCCFFQI